MNKKILISAGVHNRDWVLPYYLDHIYNISYDKKLIDIYWIVNNCLPSDKSLLLLKDFKNKYGNEYNSIKIEVMNSSRKIQDERITQVRMDHTYLWLSKIRNKIFSKCVSLGCDYLASIDSDILVPKNCLNDLLDTGKQICSSLIWNGFLFASIEEAYKFPNILNFDGKQYKHIVNYYVKNPDKSSKDKIIECDATGAFSIISKEVCANTYYKSHPQGEDMGWADVCREKGCKMYCLPYVYSLHCMSPEILQYFIDTDQVKKL